MTKSPALNSPKLVETLCLEPVCAQPVPCVHLDWNNRKKPGSVFTWTIAHFQTFAECDTIPTKCSVEINILLGPGAGIISGTNYY